MFAYYVHDLSPYIFRFNDRIALHWYGLAYVAAFVAGVYVVRALSRKGFCDIPPDRVADFIVGGAVFGVMLGGRLGYMLFYRLQEFLRDPLMILWVWDGGMSAHGGIIGLTLYTLWYARRHRVAWRNIGDSLVVAAPIGLFLGRLANFINGELYGRVTSVAWAVQFPKELYDAPDETWQLALAEARQLNPEWNTIPRVIDASVHSEALRNQLAGTLSPRHPSQIYEALLEGAFLFAVLWVLRTRFRLANGIVTGAFFLGYAVLRSVAELFREPDAPLTGALTRGQFLSIFLAAIGIAFLVSARVRPAWPLAWGSPVTSSPPKRG